MTINYLDLLFQLLLFALGVYLYLFARGLVRTGSGPTAERAEAFRQDNATWMRLLGLALAAVTAANIVLQVVQLTR